MEIDFLMGKFFLLHYQLLNKMMNFISRLLRVIFTIYCTIFFLISFPIVIPIYFLVFNLFPKDKAPHIAHAISRLWARYLMIVFMINLKIENRDYINEQQTYIFVSNHRSMLDIPIYALACTNTFRFLSKAELGKVPLLGYVIRKLYITVNRKDKHDRSKSLEKMLASLKEGISVFLAPEGTRNTSSEKLLPFKEGAFRLAITSQLPVAILTIRDSQKLLAPARPFEMCPGKIVCRWSQPISTIGMTEKDLPLLIELVRNAMMKDLD
jgi:1-acyl-sn-glycerol-3-phosphate acyltransferase